MVEVIGLVTIVALSWLLASTMANESDAEKRRRLLPGAKAMVSEEEPADSMARHAA